MNSTSFFSSLLCVSFAMAVGSATIAATIEEAVADRHASAGDSGRGEIQAKSGEETVDKLGLGALSEVLKKELAQWFRRLEAVDPGITLDSFVKQREFKRKLQRYPYTVGSDFPVGEERLRKRLYVYSQDKAKALDPYVYSEFHEEDGVVSLINDIDSAVDLIDFEKKERTRLFFCGSSCGFEAAAWLDDETVVAASLEVDFDATTVDGTVYRTLILVYSTADNKFTIYEGPRVGLKELIKAPDDPLDQRLKQTFPNAKQ